MLPSTEQPIQYAHSTCEAGVAELHIQDALPEDDGTYTCVAENTLGRASCSARVTVHGRSLCKHICFGERHLKAGRWRRRPPAVHSDVGLAWEMGKQWPVPTPQGRGKMQREEAKTPLAQETPDL